MPRSARAAKNGGAGTQRSGGRTPRSRIRPSRIIRATIDGREAGVPGNGGEGRAPLGPGGEVVADGDRALSVLALDNHGQAVAVVDEIRRRRQALEAVEEHVARRDALGPGSRSVEAQVDEELQPLDRGPGRRRS